MARPKRVKEVETAAKEAKVPEKMKEIKAVEEPVTPAPEKGIRRYVCTQATFWRGRVHRPGEITTFPEAAKAPHCFKEIED